ncbi:hypothetical protein RSOLAG22IIIB_07788 [Rhizoctonia solani]|uniref:DUF6533 domain-containing protein n=1 Tax=Rhizoctonia solani TaxID=456999 RepID=A0A0K6FPY9_9AGAM|nr:hypothetical protein RSOLAG22IIIB_07788 [Rhizoctonia solani]
MSGPPELNPEQLAEAIAEITFAYESLSVTKHLSVAATTILIYEILSTLEVEIKYFWKSNWTFARVAFHLNRLWIILLMGAYMPTLFIYGLSETADPLLTATLMVRVWIIYGKGRWFLVGLLASFFVITVPTIIAHIVSLMSVHWIPNPAPDYISACLFSPNRLAFLPYITGLIYETLLFLLTLFKTWRLSQNRMIAPLMTRLLKDGSCYYLVVLLFGLFSCVGALNSKLAGAAIGSGSLSVVMSCMCSRMILSTRSFYDEINRPSTPSEREALPLAVPRTSRSSTNTSSVGSPLTPRKGWPGVTSGGGIV